MSKMELRLAGSGGQGVILATAILAEAAVIAGKNTAQSQSYGPEARGGSCKAEVIVSDERSGFVTESLDRFCASIAAPIISEGDALGLVVFVANEGDPPAGDTEYKLAQTIAGFLGRHMEA